MRSFKIGKFRQLSRCPKPIFEIRSVYYGKVGKTVVILLCAGIKGTQKRDIGRAKQYWQDYLSN